MNFEKYINKLSPDKLAIFLFHGVVEKPDYEIRNYTRKHLEKDEFYKLLNFLKSSGNALSMPEIVEHHLEKTPFPENAFAVSFDDGFENNFSIAAPILEALNIPATFYVSTYLIQNNAMTWIDQVEYSLEKTKSGTIRLPGFSKDLSFNSKETKIKVADTLRCEVKTRKEIDIELLVQTIFSQCQMEPVNHSDDQLDKKMSWDQIRKLHEREIFTIGGHSHHHVNLASLNDDDLEFEIRTSIQFLKKEAGIEVKHYSYPEGLEYCYSEKVIQKLKSYNIICSPTAIDGGNDLATDLFHLRRIPVV